LTRDAQSGRKVRRDGGTKAQGGCQRHFETTKAPAPLHNTAAGLQVAQESEDAAAGDDAEAATNLPAMECQPFEHYDYMMLMFRHEQDFQRACEVLGIKKVEVTYPGGLQKIGLGRVIDGAKAIERLSGQ
jgi:hypothetical protein